MTKLSKFGKSYDEIRKNINAILFDYLRKADNILKRYIYITDDVWGYVSLTPDDSLVCA